MLERYLKFSTIILYIAISVLSSTMSVWNKDARNSVNISSAKLYHLPQQTQMYRFYFASCLVGKQIFRYIIEFRNIIET